MTYLIGANYPAQGPAHLDISFEQAADAYRAGSSFVAMGYAHPDARELKDLQDLFNLHDLAVEDASQGHQRAKLERYDDRSFFIVGRPAIYLDDSEEVKLGETHVFMGEKYFVALTRDSMRTQGEMRDKQQLALVLAAPDMSPARLLHRMVDSMVDGYAPVLAGLEHDNDQIEDALFADDISLDRDLAKRIYALLTQVIDFQRAVKPLERMLPRLTEYISNGTMSISPYPGASAEDIAAERTELLRQFRDVYDHTVRIKEGLEDLRSSLENALRVHDTLVGQQQNEDMKRISAWAALLMVPTIVGSVYGMNFDDMPELHWEYGYPAALGLMLISVLILVVVFRRKNWF